ncbi:MAG: FliH/SctL family protein [Planctomycetota bacterium]
MGMIRRADLEQLTRDALVMNLDDMRSRADEILDETSRQAERMLAEAQAERERLISTAREEGYAKGHEEGTQAGLAEGIQRGEASALEAESQAIGSLVQGWQGALAQFESRREDMLRNARDDVVRLAVEIASRVVRRAVDLDPAAVGKQIEAVLGAVVRPTRLTVRVHPDDLDAAERSLPVLLSQFELCTQADLRADPSVGRGSAVASTEGGGRIDASIGGQLDRLIAELLPEDAGLLAGRDAAGPEDKRSDAA